MQETASSNPGNSSMRSGPTRAPEIHRLMAQWPEPEAAAQKFPKTPALALPLTKSLHPNLMVAKDLNTCEHTSALCVCLGWQHLPLPHTVYQMIPGHLRVWQCPDWADSVGYCTKAVQGCSLYSTWWHWAALPPPQLRIRLNPQDSSAPEKYSAFNPIMV